MKLLSADDSVGPPHVKVGHCQALIPKTPYRLVRGFFMAQVGRRRLGRLFAAGHCAREVGAVVVPRVAETRGRNSQPITDEAGVVSLHAG